MCDLTFNSSDGMYIGETWETNCKHTFQFMDGDIQDNNFKYCPYCGDEINEVKEDNFSQGEKDE